MTRLVLWLRSLLFALIFYPGSVLFVTAAALVRPFSQAALTSVVHGWGRFHRIACRLILGQRVRVIGTLSHEPVLFVFKHESMFETIDLLCLLDAPVPIAKQELIDIPAWGPLAQAYGVIGLRRDDGAKALRRLQTEAKRAIAAGRPICLFPEGTRVPHGEAAPLRSGFAALYKLLALPVVPIAVDSGRISPRNSFVKLPGTITYLVGETIPPGLTRAEAERRAHEAINALNAPPRN
jgi:1-acyl-sn-glycerol-3-phosphate acyltransferase